MNHDLKYEMYKLWQIFIVLNNTFQNVKTKGGSEEEGEGEQNRGEKNEEAEQDPDVRKYLHQAVKPQPLDKHAPKPGHVDRRSRHQRDVRDGDKLGFHRKPIPKPIYLKDTEQPDHVERNDERDDSNAEANVDETELQQEGKQTCREVASVHCSTVAGQNVGGGATLPSET